MNTSTTAGSRAGIGYALACYATWGFVPLYWKSLHTVPAPEILAHRILWSAVFFAFLLARKSRISELLKALQSPLYLRTYLLTAALVGTNWLIYIYAVNSGHVLESSLGYFINPLVNVVLGLLFLNERLRAIQWVSVALAALGVAFLAVQAEHFPFIALSLAVSFGLYGLFRKKAPLDPLLGSTLESMMLMPLAACFLGVLFWKNEGALAHQSWNVQALLVLGGAVTAWPLLWFAEAAKRLPLSTMGFFQYLSPTFQFLLAVFLYHETFTQVHAISFGFIWAALALFLFDTQRNLKLRKRIQA